jgi:hypothetical protein
MGEIAAPGESSFKFALCLGVGARPHPQAKRPGLTTRAIPKLKVRELPPPTRTIAKYRELPQPVKVTSQDVKVNSQNVRVTSQSVRKKYLKKETV